MMQEYELRPGNGWEQRPTGLFVPPRRRHLRPTGIDLFCGAGGFSLGFIRAGFEVVCALDNDAPAAYTYLTNLGEYGALQIHFPTDDDRERFTRYFERYYQKLARKKGHQIVYEPYAGLTAGSAWLRSEHLAGRNTPGVTHYIFGDARNVTGRQILDWIGMERGEVGCVFGGPPCQGFSTSGKRNVMDPRNSLVMDFCRLVCEIQPHTMVFENVPGIVSMTTPEGIPVLDAMTAILAEGGMGTYDALRKAIATSAGCGAAIRGTRKPVKRTDGADEQPPEKIPKKERPSRGSAFQTSLDFALEESA